MSGLFIAHIGEFEQNSVVAGLPVPDAHNNVALVVVGFYFGKNTKVEQSSNAA
jgi:hypothetical protein